ncbi:MAG: hypothetical protein Q9188_002885, partial [Gyalolechia gomerana]
MPTSRIRGGTPYSYHGKQHSINDPKLTALLEELGQHNRSWAAEHLQAAAEAARATYQPPPDIYTPDREVSPPAAGLFSPAASTPDHYPQHDTTSPSHPAVGDVTSLQPATLKVGDPENVLASIEPVADPFQPSKPPQSPRTFHQQEHGNPPNFSPILSPNAINNNLADDQNHDKGTKPTRTVNVRCATVSATALSIDGHRTTDTPKTIDHHDEIKSVSEEIEGFRGL